MRLVRFAAYSVSLHTMQNRVHKQQCVIVSGLSFCLCVYMYSYVGKIDFLKTTTIKLTTYDLQFNCHII